MASFLQVNINGLRSKATILADYLHLKDVDIVLICETKTKPGTRDCHIPGYNLAARHDTDLQNGGGTAVYVRMGITAAPIPTDNLQNDCAAISIKLPRIGDIALVSVYISPTSTLHFSTFNHFITNHNKVIFMGDFNSHHQCISDLCSFTNPNGHQLYAALNQAPIQLVNRNGSSTRLHQTGTESILDLIIVTNNVSHYVSEHFVGEDVGSDHLPVHLILTDSTQPTYEVTVRRNLKKADWQHFWNLTEENIRQLRNLVTDPPATLGEIDEIVDLLSGAITQSLDVVAPLKCVKHRTFTLSATTLELIREKRRARRLFQRHPNSDILRNTFNRLSRQVTDAVAQEKKRQWHEACNGLDHRNGSDFWKQFKRMTGGGRSHKTQRVLDPQGNMTTDDESTAQTLANHLARCHTPNSGPMFDAKVFAEVTNLIRQNTVLFTPQLQPFDEEGDDHDLMRPITSQTVLDALGRCSNTSPGEDTIGYDIIKRCHPIIYSYLEDLYNHLMMIGYFPRPWKAAIGVLIPKPGKDDKIPGNNRPISLLRCFGKLFEKCISRPLIDHLVTSQLLNPWQRAYLPRKEANEHVFRFSTHIRSALDLGWTSAAILLDVEKAFDSVWQDGLRHKLTKFGLPNKLIRLLSSFLEGRTIAVRVGNTVSRQVPLMAGTPQGSVLSPILFNIYVNDIPFEMDSKVHISQFADDLALWTSYRSNKNRGHMLLRQRLQDCMDLLQDWCATWHVKMNAAKSQLLYFNRYPRLRIPQESKEVTLFGTPIPIVKEAKLLGLTFTAPYFNLRQHCKNLRHKAESRIGLLRCLRGTEWGANVPTLLHLYKVFIRPVLETGYVALQHAKISDLRHLLIAENKALRVALKQFYTPGESRTTNAALQQMYGQPNILERLERLREKATQERFADSPLIEEMEAALLYMTHHRKRHHRRISGLVNFVDQFLIDNT